MAKIITVHFTNLSVPAVGLTPTIDIWELNPIVPTSNILVVNNGATTEIGGGWYRYEFLTYNPTKNYVFTFDGGALLSDCDRFKIGGNDSYEEDISFGVWEESAVSHTSSGSTGLMLNQIKADTTSIVISEVLLTSLVNTLLKFERNRTKIDVLNATLTVYDDNCTDVLHVFKLKDANGFPSVAEVCERSPLSCP